MATSVRSQKKATRDQIVEAALATLQKEGYAGTSIRAIARSGGFNSALIFYYFGSLNGLLLAALDHSSTARMDRYRAAVGSASSLADLISIAVELYREDVEAGHITVFSELMGASLSHPELAPEMIARAQPWVDFLESTIERFLTVPGLEDVLPKRDLAYAILAFYLGVNLLTHLDGDRSRIESLFAAGERVLPLLSALSP